MSNRALWVIPVGELGGVARHALDVARVGIPGWDVTFVAPPGPIGEKFALLGAEHIEGNLGPNHGLRESITTMRRVIKQLRPTVVHSHLSYADVIAALTKARGTRLVTTEHGIADNDLVYHGSAARSRIAARFHSLRMRRLDAFVAVSEATLRVAEKKWVLPKSLYRTVVYNGVDRPDEVTSHPGLRIASLARFAPEKRLDRLVEAFASVAAEHPQAHLTLAGIGPLHQEITAQVQALGLGSQVSLPGYVDAGQLLLESDVVAQLSVFENCSYSLLDAVAYGLGVVATPVGGNPEILPKGSLVDADDTQRVADTLLTQGLDPTARPRLSSDWPTVSEMTHKLADVYERIAR